LLSNSTAKWTSSSLFDESKPKPLHTGHILNSPKGDGPVPLYLFKERFDTASKIQLLQSMGLVFAYINLHGNVNAFSSNNESIALLKTFLKSVVNIL
jgi:hypothetical protein